MKKRDFKPEPNVYSSIIDILYNTGLAWAKYKARQIFQKALEQGNLEEATAHANDYALKVNIDFVLKRNVYILGNTNIVNIYGISIGK